MKKAFNKIKTSLVAVWITLISLPFKVKGVRANQSLYGTPETSWAQGNIQYNPGVQGIYGVPSPISDQTFNIIKITGPILIAITFIVGIVSFFKIRKIGDETLKKKKIKRTIIIISIATIIIIALIVTTRLIKNK